jgi:hypothetical protein
MAKEKGVIGLNMLKAIQRFVDPDQIMNPGKLLPDDSDSGFNASEYVGPGLA